MKPIDEMTEEEILQAVQKIQKQEAKRKAFFATNRSNARREAKLKDPKAYFTRRQDFEDAEKRGEDISHVPKLNTTG
jgi:hypothetical protein